MATIIGALIHQNPSVEHTCSAGYTFPRVATAQSITLPGSDWWIIKITRLGVNFVDRSTGTLGSVWYAGNRTLGTRTLGTKRSIIFCTGFGTTCAGEIRSHLKVIFVYIVVYSYYLYFASVSKFVLYCKKHHSLQYARYREHLQLS